MPGQVSLELLGFSYADRGFSPGWALGELADLEEVMETQYALFKSLKVEVKKKSLKRISYF